MMALFLLFYFENLTTCFDETITVPNEFNVILISIDTLRADHLGCYGYNKDITPNIDQFSKGGILFRNCFSQAPSTTPAHASIFTSLIPVHHGASYLPTRAIKKGAITITEFLKKKNFRTASFNGGVQVSAIYGFNRGFDIYESVSGKDIPSIKFSSIVNKAQNWIENNRERPFFMFLHTYETHSPYTPKKEHLRIIENNYKGALLNDISERFLHVVSDYRNDINNLLLKINGDVTEVINSDDLAHIINAYDAEISSVDEALGTFFKFLKKANLYDNSIIIFTSDHGEEFGEHGNIGLHSRTLYDESIRVPLIIKFPGLQNKEIIVEKQARSIDIFPTIIRYLNDEIPMGLEGADLLPLAIGDEHKELCAVSQKEDVNFSISSIRTREWKLYDNCLYDLINDPGENKDVALDLDKVETVISLRRKLKEAIASESFIDNSEEKNIRIHSELKEQLRSLGYNQ